MNGIKLKKKDLENPIVVAAMGLREDEVALALQIMDHDGDNVAHFGINGCFIYSEYDRTEGGLQ